MDNNNPQPVPPQPPVQPAQFATSPVSPTSTSEDGSKKMMIWLVGGVILILLAVGGVYLYMSRKQAESKLQTNNNPAPASQQDNLESDLNSINVESAVDSEFTTVDSDLQNL